MSPRSHPKRKNRIQRKIHHLVCRSSITPRNGVSVETEKSDTDDGFQSSSEKGSTKSQRSIKNKANNDTDSGWSESESYYKSFIQTMKERKEQLVERLKTYNDLFQFHKSAKDDQRSLCKKLQDIDELYIHNIAAIARLGHCPNVHKQTSPVGEKLVRVHRKLKDWDKKFRGIFEILRAPSSQETTSAVVKILKVCDNPKFAQYKGDYNDISLPEIVWNLDNPFLEQLDASKLASHWETVRGEIEKTLCSAEMQFQDICLEYGITRGPERIVSSSDSKKRAYAYENASMNLELAEIDSEQPFINEDVEKGYIFINPHCALQRRCTKLKNKKSSKGELIKTYRSNKIVHF